MKTFLIDGIIGIDIKLKDIKTFFNSLNGEEIIVEISSPGGYVSEGLSIFNTIRDYSRKYNTITKLIGLAASMSSYIAMAGNRVIAEDNAIFMIHNPLAVEIGDHRKLRKTANELEEIKNLLANAYSKKSGKSKEEINKLMDEETFYYGNESLDAGFIDEIIDTENQEDKSAMILIAKDKIDNCKSTIKKMKKNDDIEKAVALLNENLNESEIENFEPENPYPNEHAARLLNPDTTPKDRVRRTSGSGKGRVQGKIIPTSIDIIWYIKGKGENVVIRAQALRFPIKKWTESEARKWLKDNEIKYISFEPATNKTQDNFNINLKNKEIKNMTSEEIKEKYPESYNKIYDLGKKSVIDNIEAHSQWFDVAPNAVIEAIKKNENFTSTHASKYLKAKTCKTEIQNRKIDDQNIGDVLNIDDQTINGEEIAFKSFENALN